MKKIELILDGEQQGFFDRLKNARNALLIPVDKWKSIIHVNLGNSRVRDPEYRIAGAFVITEKDAFELFVGSIRGVFYGRPESINTLEYGAFSFAGKLELKRVTSAAPNHDIFDVGFRQSGSFRSK